MQRVKTYFALAAAFVLGVVVSILTTGCQPPADSPVSKVTSSKTTSSSSRAKPLPVEPVDADRVDGSARSDDSDAPDSRVAVVSAELAKPPTGDGAVKPFPFIDKTANAVIKPGDWNQWGGTSYRNNTPDCKNVPIAWHPGGFDRKTGAWIHDGLRDARKPEKWAIEPARNIKWVTPLGSQTYGNPVIVGGKVFVGTNNSGGLIKRYSSDVDLGVLLCLNEADGKFLWQHSSEKLHTGRVHDWPMMGICCAPLVEGDRVWFVTSRGEVRCLDAEGFYDHEDDGPVKNDLGRLFDVMKNEDPTVDQVAGILTALGDGQVNEFLRGKFAAAGAELPDEIAVKTDDEGKKWSIGAQVSGASREFRLTLQGPRFSAFKVISPADLDEADVVWVVDMMKELGISQHNMCSCSVTSFGDLLFVITGNGVDDSHKIIPAPDAPSFVVMDKNSGQVYWTDKSPGLNIHHGQWSSPAVATLGGVPQVLFGGGDCWLYSFRADKGQDGKPELLWKADLNPKEAELILGGRGTRNDVIGTPVVYDGLVYLAVGQDPEHAEGPGSLWCIDPNKRGDVSLKLAVKRDTREVIPHKRIKAVEVENGEVEIDNPNSAIVWHFDQKDDNGDGEFQFEEIMHRSCGTVAIKNDLLFVADFSGLFHCFDAKNGRRYWVHDMLAASWGSPLITDQHVYIGDEDGDVAVFGLSAEPPRKPIFEVNMVNSVYSTPVVANGVLYIVNRTHLYAIQAPETAAGGSDEK